MSLIACPLKRTIASAAVIGFALVACGDDGDPAGGGADDKAKPSTSAKKDAGAADAAKDAGARSSATVEPGDSCSGTRRGKCSSDACDTPPCVAPCDDGEYGECVSEEELDQEDAAAPPTGISLPDGSAIEISDAGVSISIGDAKVAIPATQCPEGLTCSNIGAAIGVPISYCSDNGITPPACSSMADCTALGFKIATCGMSPIGGMACLQVCK